MMRWTRRAPLALVVGVGLLLTSACGESLDESGDEQDEQAATGGDGKESWPETISYGLLPTDDVDDLVANFTPFEEYMASCLDHPFELFTATDYTAMVEAMRTGSIHLSRFGPFSYILAHDRAGAEAIAIGVSDPSQPTYRSLIITRKSHGFEELTDLEGRSFAFVDPTSSSGHLYPRAMLIEELGITNDDVDSWFGNMVFAGNHEASLVSVLNGDTDAGALASNASAIANNGGTWEIRPDGEFADHANADDFMVLAESEDIPPTAETVQQDLPQSLKDAFLGCLEGVADDPGLAEFRENVGGVAAGFVPIDDADYDVVRDTAAALGMAPEDLLNQ